MQSNQKTVLFLNTKPFCLGGLGVLLTFTSMAAYLIDAFPGFSASVMSVNICLRYIAASLMSIIAAPVKNAIGNGT